MFDCLAFSPMKSPTEIQTCNHSVCPLSETSSTVNVPAWIFPNFLLCLDARGKSRLIRSQVSQCQVSQSCSVGIHCFNCNQFGFIRLTFLIRKLFHPFSDETRSLLGIILTRATIMAHNHPNAYSKNLINQPIENGFPKQSTKNPTSQKRLIPIEQGLNF